MAKKLRNSMTPGEIAVWQMIKGKKLMGYDFDRQRPIDEFIVDFYCKDLMLAIEIDGFSHDSLEAQLKDEYRQKTLESFGIHFLRFSESDAKNHSKSVVEAIQNWIMVYISSSKI
ncbi:endonuclease domain-containing protein [[Limnothrix rosea] IAM M-220]|uniref:endonuclease domain-containing protein n=1 Tax=[Limnothrix rosea] IAM M-220 TaxID=454133 RepID=UPI001CEC3489|nr:endonuclease domain-containing protein [[Limnothrix rosea] IAM M-220]